MSKCRACGREIRFALTRNRQHQPVNPDGSLHFATCMGVRRKPTRRQVAERTQPDLIEGYRECEHGCTNGLISIERDGRSYAKPCPIHRRTA